MSHSHRGASMQRAGPVYSEKGSNVMAVKHKVKLYRLAAMLELEVEGETPEARRDDAVRQAQDAVFLKPDIKYLVLDDIPEKDWSELDLVDIAQGAQRAAKARKPTEGSRHV